MKEYSNQEKQQREKKEAKRSLLELGRHQNIEIVKLQKVTDEKIKKY